MAYDSCARYMMTERLIDENDGVLSEEVIKTIPENMRMYCVTEYYACKFRNTEKQITFTLKDIPKEYHVYGVCMNAIRRDFANIEYIDERDKGYYENEYYRNIIIYDWRNIEKVPIDKRNVYVCYYAFSETTDSHKFIPIDVLQECNDIKDAYEKCKTEQTNKEIQSRRTEESVTEEHKQKIRRTMEEEEEIRKKREEKKINDEQNKIVKSILQEVIQNIGRVCTKDEVENIRRRIKEMVQKVYNIDVKIKPDVKANITTIITEIYK